MATKKKNKIVYLSKVSKLNELLERYEDKSYPIIFIEDTKLLYVNGSIFDFSENDVTFSKIEGLIAGSGVSVDCGKNSFIIGTDNTTGAVLFTVSEFKDGKKYINIKSDALTWIDVNEDSFVKWDDSTRKILLISRFNDESDATKTEWIFGENSSENTSIVKIPKITVDKYGVITKAEDLNVTIKNDAVEQSYLKPQSTDTNYELLATTTPGESRTTGSVYKTGGLTYNPKTETLSTSVINATSIKLTGGLTLDGDITIGGSGTINGSATPIVHIGKYSETKPENTYGGASTMAYGHVRLQDEFSLKDGVIAKPNSVGNNTNAADSIVLDSVAASPLLVYNAYTAAVIESKAYTDEKIEGIVIAAGGVQVSAKDQLGQGVEIKDKLKFNSDFVVAPEGGENGISIAWYRI